ncbi:unnamed protein product [Penicillium egyptiacum]|uniref:Uncharacterized protein n=1 Tax=Penicillium egyptiacum TaxID=1303716 RepID=A0A9W4KA43_9EURO|nr:unnamed protein product [Penicillium egyptiacum]
MEPPPTPRPPAPTVPSTVYQWIASARDSHLLTNNPSKLRFLHSGSKVTFKEYLSMRIIRRVSNITEFPDRETKGRAKEMIKGDEAIQTWLSHIETDEYPTDRKLGMFALVRQGQLAIVASDFQEPFQTVELRRRGRPQASELSADTRDAVLVLPLQLRQLNCLLQPRGRGSSTPQRMENRRRLLISLDRHEMYLTLARYHEDYVKFLKGEFQGLKSYPEDRFLHLHEYGPWDIGKKSHMRDLTEIIVGFSLRVKDKQAKSAVPSGSGPEGT